MQEINLDFIKNETIGAYEVTTKVLTEQEAKFYNLRALLNNRLEALVNAGTYKVLTKDGEIVMSNTQLEITTHQEAIEKAKGNILVAGLGLGMFLTAIKDKKEVKKIVVVEKSEEIIQMIGKYYKDNKIEIINEDIFDFSTKDTFDLIWIDIWNDFNNYNLEEMEYLKEKFSSNSKEILCWSEDILRKSKKDLTSIFSFS